MTDSQIIPASFFVFRDLIHTAGHAIIFTPEDIAKRYKLHVERSFDDLGDYVFVGFQLGEHYFGLRRYIGDPIQGTSVVSVLGAENSEKRDLIAEALNLNLEDVHELDMYEY